MPACLQPPTQPPPSPLLSCLEKRLLFEHARCRSSYRVGRHPCAFVPIPPAAACAPSQAHPRSQTFAQTSPSKFVVWLCGSFFNSNKQTAHRHRHTDTYAHTQTHRHTDRHTRTHTHTHTHTHTNTYAHAHTHTHTHTRTDTHTEAAVAPVYGVHQNANYGSARKAVLTPHDSNTHHTLVAIPTAG